MLIIERLAEVVIGISGRTRALHALRDAQKPSWMVARTLLNTWLASAT